MCIFTKISRHRESDFLYLIDPTSEYGNWSRVFVTFPFGAVEPRELCPCRQLLTAPLVRNA